MLRKSLFTAAMMLLLIPALASAGLVGSYVATGSASGTVSPTGFAFKAVATPLTITANANYTLDVVKNNGVAVAVTGTGPWAYTVPLTSTTQNVYVYFKKTTAAQPTQLLASLPATGNVPGTLSGQTSTIKYLAPGTTATATFSGAGLTFTPAVITGVTSPNQIITTVTGSASGVVTLTLTAPGATPSTANCNIAFTPAGVTGSATCLACHNGWPEATSYASSIHANNSSPTCQACHNPTGTGTHPFATATSAVCESCHASSLSTTTHPVALTASKCITCHDSHDPAQGIAELTPSNHPAVTLYTFEEVGMQMAGGAKVPVQVDANGKGMPYSPKQTCGTSGCHVKNGIDYTYDKISDHAFHSGQGRSEYQDSSDGKFNATKNKPWLQSTAMVGKW